LRTAAESPNSKMTWRTYMPVRCGARHLSHGTRLLLSRHDTPIVFGRFSTACARPTRSAAFPRSCLRGSTLIDSHGRSSIGSQGGGDRTRALVRLAGCRARRVDAARSGSHSRAGNPMKVGAAASSASSVLVRSMAGRDRTMPYAGEARSLALAPPPDLALRARPRPSADQQRLA